MLSSSAPCFCRVAEVFNTTIGDRARATVRTSVRRSQASIGRPIMVYRTFTRSDPHDPDRRSRPDRTARNGLKSWRIRLELTGCGWKKPPALPPKTRFAARHLRRHIESGDFEAGAIQRNPPPHSTLAVSRWARPALRRQSRQLGRTQQVDFTFSAAKSYLNMLAGIAVMDGLISRRLMNRWAGPWTMVALRNRIMAPSHGGICCRTPRNGRARCSASRT